jgi:hypothetical protein
MFEDRFLNDLWINIRGYYVYCFWWYMRFGKPNTNNIAKIFFFWNLSYSQLIVRDVN